METKLTLRLDEKLIADAKKEADARGTSLSRMVADYFRSMDSRKTPRGASHPPITASLVGALKGKRIDRAQYGRHLEKKYQ